MLVLVTDTSGKHGSVALARAHEDGDEVHVIDSVPLVGGTFSAQLVPQIANLLEKHGFRKNEIDAFVVVSGPGSFTGLRVGLAAIKALAEILHKPIVPVSLLEVVALAPGIEGRILALLDAGRGELYAGEYLIANQVARPLHERLIRKQELPTIAAGLLVSTPETDVAKMAMQFGLSVFDFAGVIPEMIAKLGWRKMRAGETVSPEQLDANYSRRSDAELFVKPTPSTTR
jgi:tRNA threonylcarbamoyladenosine biosynthesis protein TsaB